MAGALAPQKNKKGYSGRAKIQKGDVAVMSDSTKNLEKKAKSRSEAVQNRALLAKSLMDSGPSQDWTRSTKG